MKINTIQKLSQFFTLVHYLSFQHDNRDNKILQAENSYLQNLNFHLPDQETNLEEAEKPKW
jgi:hypothetical protein